MKYDGVELILDNFRSVLFDMSVDVQDIVRSAILDGIDISKYIVPCRENPYKLDQIRLSLKEKLPEGLLGSLSGEMLYQLRVLKRRGVDLSEVEAQLADGSLSDEYMEYMLGWLGDGINIKGLNIATIPKNLLQTFDYGLRSGFDMSPYNTGFSYAPDYIMLCLMISKNGKSVYPFLSGNYSLEVLNILNGISKISTRRWNLLVSNIDSGISGERLNLLIPCIKSGLSIEELQSKQNGKYVYADECIELLYHAYLSNLDYRKVMEKTTNPVKMKEMISELELEKRNTQGFKLRKH